MEAFSKISFEQLPAAVAEMKEDIKNLLSTTNKIIEGLNSPKENQPHNIPVDIDTASELTGLAINTLYRYCREGRIPCYKRGKRLMFYGSELDKWVHDGRRKTIEERVAESGKTIIPLTYRQK